MSGIIRIEKNENYTHISNIPANDKELSWEARGLLYYLLTKPNGWQCRNQDLINKGPAGGDKIERILDELQEHGYLKRIRIQSEDGTFDWDTTIYEQPIEVDEQTKTRLKVKEQKRQEKNKKRLIRYKATIGGESTDGQSTNGFPPDIVITDSYHEEEENKLQKITLAYQNNINISISPLVIDEITSDEYYQLPWKWWEEAFKIAVSNNVRKWSYIRGVLDRSREAGLSPDTLGPPEQKRPYKKSDSRIVSGKVERTSDGGYQI